MLLCWPSCQWDPFDRHLLSVVGIIVLPRAGVPTLAQQDVVALVISRRNIPAQLQGAEGWLDCQEFVASVRFRPRLLYSQQGTWRTCEPFIQLAGLFRLISFSAASAPHTSMLQRLER